MEKQNVPMHQYPQTTDLANQPPTYAQDPTQQQQYPSQYNTTTSPPPASGGMQGPHTYVTPTTPDPNQPGAPAPDYTAATGDGQKGLTGMGQGGQPGMPPQQPAGQQYNNATPIAALNRAPAPADCPACGQRAMTTVTQETGNFTHLLALGLCCIACLGCIPYCMSSTKDVVHKCGKCGVLLATWHRSGTTEVHIHS